MSLERRTDPVLQVVLVLTCSRKVASARVAIPWPQNAFPIQ